MLLKALKIKISLTEISVKEKKLTPLIEEDWELAEVIVKVLSKFFYATKLIESQTQPLPTTRLYCIFTDLKNYLNHLYNDVNYIKFKDVFEKMIKKFNKYWDLIKDYAILLNTLDPKYKLDTLEVDEQIRVKARLATMYDDYKK